MTPSVALERSTTVDRPTEPASSAATDADVPADLFALLLAAFASPAPLAPSPPADGAPAPVAATAPGALVVDLRTVATLTSVPGGVPGPIGVEPPSPAGSVEGEAAAGAELVVLDPLAPDSADPVAPAPGAAVVASAALASAALVSVTPAVASVAAPATTARTADAPSAAPAAAPADLALETGIREPIPSVSQAPAIPVPSGPDAPAVESAAPPVPQTAVPAGSERRADVVRAASGDAVSGDAASGDMGAFEPSPVPSGAPTAPGAPGSVVAGTTNDVGDGTGSGPGPDASVRTRLAVPRTAGADGEAPTVDPTLLGPREVAPEVAPEPAEAASEPTRVQTTPAPTPVASAPVVVRPAALVSAAEVHQVAPTPAPVPEQLVDVVAPLRDRGDGSYRLAVDVHPGELGRVRLDVQVDAGTVHINLRADQPATARLLEGSLDQLRQALESSGVATGQLSLSDGGRQQPGGTERGRGSRRNGNDDDPVGVPLTTAPAHRPGSVERALDVLL
ncbi:MAG: flagellar hook-length control protein FliK [Acidimicrobiales bacterium]